MNIMTLNGFNAKIEYDPDIDAFRGEILGLNGGADFYGKTPEELRKEFKLSLETFLDVCKEKGITPTKNFSGKFNLRMSQELHNKIAVEAASSGKSINQWVVDTLTNSIE
ncbi:MAG: type II toxin-antitoxin system HicB family antitoxin [Deferribacteres bacterium]|nr:type II toxin-antitoxin system HicB family antitoxin [candidate division KSB1 bacterium]MCB9502730.1 type II toxin-antitoxin system HicB family antitoxin [Deferribacteres bacterium]